MKRISLLAPILLALICSSVSARILYVPSQFPTIQTGIDSSANGDTVLVERGIYNTSGSINFHGRAIVLTSQYLLSQDSTDRDSTCIRDPIVINSGHILASILNGFTIEAINNTPAVWCDSSSPIISNNTIRNNRNIISNGGGIYCHNSNATIRDNIIYGNVVGEYPIGCWGGGVCCEGPGSNSISNNIFSNNNALGGGGGIYCGGGNVLIYGNQFNSNSDGIRLVFSNSIIANNTIRSSTSKGISSDNSINFIFNNIILGNYFGIELLDGTTTLINNNITLSTHTGIFSSGDSTYLVNNVIRGNPRNYRMTRPLPSIQYCNIEGIAPENGNIDINPLFRDAANGDFHLMSLACGDSLDSPCIDAGNPWMTDSLLSCAWGLGTERSDMGAYGGGILSQVGIDEIENTLPQAFSLSQNYPNPFNPATTIKYDLPLPCRVRIDIYDILGRRVTTLVDEEQVAGAHQAIWNAGDKSSGIYFYRIQTGEFIETKKMMLMK